MKNESVTISTDATFSPLRKWDVIRVGSSPEGERLVVRVEKGQSHVDVTTIRLRKFKWKWVDKLYMFCLKIKYFK